MAMFMQQLFGIGESTWTDHGYREEEEEEDEAYHTETISYRIYPEPPSYARYPEPPPFGHFFEPPMFDNYPAAAPPFGMFFEPSVVPRHHLDPPKLVRFRETVEQPRPQASRLSQPRKVHPEIELMVPMCCSRCEGKVRNELRKMEGVTEVICNRVDQKVTVTGKVDPELLLKRARRAKKKAEFWSEKIYSKNFIDFIQSKTAPKQPEVDVFLSFRNLSSPEIELDTYDLHHETESSVTFTHASPSDSKSDNTTSPCDSEQGSSYNQLPFPFSERDAYDHNCHAERGESYNQHAPAYGVMDLHPPSVFPSSLSYRHHSYEDRNYIPDYESCSTSVHQHETSYERYDSGPYQDSQRSVHGTYIPSSYGELDDYPLNMHSSSQPLGTAGITNPNYMKMIIEY